jgi:hypothetical protein
MTQYEKQRENRLRIKATSFQTYTIIRKYMFMPAKSQKERNWVEIMAEISQMQ